MENFTTILVTYQNELNSPTLLPYKDITLDLSHHLSLIKSSKGIIRTIYEQDYDRYNFFATQYLKTRIKKLNSDTDRSCLSIHEKALLDAYEMKNLNREMDYVCFYAINNVSVVLDENVVEVKEGDCFVAMWDEVRNLVIDGDAVLF